MAYCRWCQLESASADVCDWCKRPLQGNLAPAQRAKADIHYMKVDDDASDSQFPFYAIVGVAVFLAVVVYAAVAFRPQAAAPAATTLNWSLQNQNPGPAQAAPPPPTPTSNPQLLSLTSPVQGAALPVAFPPGSNRIAPLPSNPPVGNSTKYAQSDSGRVGSVFARPNSVYFESVKFMFLPDKSGKEHLVGDIYVANDTMVTLQNVRLSITDGGYEYDLLRYGNSVDAPKYLGTLSIPSKSVAACHVIAKDYAPSDMRTGRRIQLDGMLAGAAIHVQEPIVD